MQHGKLYIDREKGKRRHIESKKGIEKTDKIYTFFNCCVYPLHATLQEFIDKCTFLQHLFIWLFTQFARTLLCSLSFFISNSPRKNSFLDIGSKHISFQSITSSKLQTLFSKSYFLYLYSVIERLCILNLSVIHPYIEFCSQ